MINFPPSDSAGAHSVVSGSCSLPKLCPEGQAVMKIKFKMTRDDLKSGEGESRFLKFKLKLLKENDKCGYPCKCKYQITIYCTNFL